MSIKNSIKEEASQSRHTMVDSVATVEEYINGSDWRIKANANTGYSAAGLINNLAGKLVANHWLDKVYSKEEGAAHRNADYHIHDLDSPCGYCFVKGTPILVAVEDGYDNVVPITIEEMMQRQEQGISNRVSSWDFGKKNYVLASAKDVRLTRKDAEIVKLTFDSGDVYYCTPDHKFLLSNEMWKEAQHLLPEDYLHNLFDFIGGPSANHVVSVEPAGRADVYCMTVETYHNFCLGNGVVAHNCCGHDLQRLLNEGFNGVATRVSSRPPKHFREALNQMANFVGILQAEWAGAQAFSSFDTYLAPILFFDMKYGKVDFHEAKQAIKNFVYNLNVPSRWGQCVKDSYKALRGDGKWVTYDELKVGDEIYVVDIESGALRKDVITHLNLFDAPEKMHRYSNEHGFKFEVTDKHRVIYKTDSSSWKIKESRELLGTKNIDIPIVSWEKVLPEWFMGDEYEISDEMLELITYILTSGQIKVEKDGTSTVSVQRPVYKFGSARFEEICKNLNISFEKSDGYKDFYFDYEKVRYDLKWCESLSKICNLLDNTADERPTFVENLSARQALIIIDTWVLLRGEMGSSWSMRTDEKELQEMLSYLAIKAHKSTFLKDYTNNGLEDILGKYGTTICKQTYQTCDVEVVNSSCKKVWCPTTNTGTFVCMTDEGYVFITGNSPFSNVTIDIFVPNDLKTQLPVRGDVPFFASIKEEYAKSNPEKIGENANWQRMVNALRERLNDFESDEDDLFMNVTYGIFQPEMEVIDEAFYGVLGAGDDDGRPFTFPIPTINVTESFDWDSKIADVIFADAAKFGSSYFQNFIGSQYKRLATGELVKDENAYTPDAVRSMCPLTFDTKVLVRSRWENTYVPIGKLWNRATNNGVKYESFYNGVWSPCRAVKIDPQPVYKIKMTNNDVVRMGELHLQPILRDGKEMTVKAMDLRVGDYIPYNMSIVDGILDDASYDLGYVVGAYMGDGSRHNKGIIYSLSADKKDDETEERIRKFFGSIGFRVTTSISGRLRSVKVGGDSFSLISKYVSGETALNKGICETINTWSVDMRNGLLDGYLATDGLRRSNRISTSSIQMVEDLQALCNSLGRRAYLSFVDAREGRLGHNPNYLVSICGTVRQNFCHRIKSVNGKQYSIIESIEIDEKYSDHLYCLEVDSDAHLFTLKSGMITHNCRLQLDKRELRKKGGGLFGADAQTGSIGVVTINMARLGYRCKGDKDKLYSELDKLLEMAKSTLEKKRVFIKEMFERGLYPYTKRYVRSFDTFFSTLGTNGMNEMIRNFTNDKEDISTPWGVKFAEEVLQHMRKRAKEFQDVTGNLYNLEAVPGEGTTFRFAKADQSVWGDKIIQAGSWEQPYYTNSSQLPASFTSDPFEALDLQDSLQTVYNGGTVLHLYMSEPISSIQACKNLVRKVLSNYRLPYISITPSYSICPIHGYIPSHKHGSYCPICDQEIIKRHKDELG